MHYWTVRAAGQKHEHEKVLLSQHLQGVVVTPATAMSLAAAVTTVFTDHTVCANADMHVIFSFSTTDQASL
jgi:hypothetical protein